MCPCERGGRRGRERKRQRQRERQRERQRDRERQRQRDRERETESRRDVDPMRVKMRKARDVNRGDGVVHLPAYISASFQHFPYVLKVSGKCQ